MTPARGIHLANAFGGDYAFGTTGAVTFQPVSGVQVRGGILYRSLVTNPADTYGLLAVNQHGGPDPMDVYGLPRGPDQGDWFCCPSAMNRGNPSNPWSPENRIDLVTSPSRWSVVVQCRTNAYACTLQPGHFVYRIFGGKVVLNDAAHPSAVPGASGGLVSDSPLRDAQEVTVNGIDAGAGIYRVRLLIDNVLAMARVIDANGGRCADVNPSNADPYEFAYQQPCKVATGATLAFNTRALPDGVHNLKLQLEDAAGNATTFVDRTVTISNGRGAPNGTPATDDAQLTAYFAATRRQQLTTRFGRPAVVHGRLHDAGGTPIADARIELLATSRQPGAAAVDNGVARTGADGAWMLILPGGGSSRTLEFRYRPYSNDATAAAQQRLLLKVRAGVRLRIRPRVLRGARTIRFAGRLLGKPVPRRGKLVELQARTKGTRRWITFKSVRSDARGRFRHRYTFRYPNRRVTYEFRARSRFETGYPYEQGASRVVRVRLG